MRASRTERFCGETNDNVLPAAVLAPSIDDAPTSHHGQTAFTREIRFSEEPDKGNHTGAIASLVAGSLMETSAHRRRPAYSRRRP